MTNLQRAIEALNVASSLMLGAIANSEQGASSRELVDALRHLEEARIKARIAEVAAEDERGA